MREAPTVTSYAVSSGAISAGLTVTSGSELIVFAGGTASQTTVNSGGMLLVNLAETSGNTISAGGSAIVGAGGADPHPRACLRRRQAASRSLGLARSRAARGRHADAGTGVAERRDHRTGVPCARHLLPCRARGARHPARRRTAERKLSRHRQPRAVRGREGRAAAPSGCCRRRAPSAPLRAAGVARPAPRRGSSSARA
jgi:autotransporter passenger strand-loop-strand repeat protein